MEEKSWNVIESHFRKYGLVHHQISSFNEFVNFGIENILSQERPIVVENNQKIYTIEFDNVFKTKPCVIEENRKKYDITPMDARSRDLTYETTIFCNINVNIEDKRKKTVEKTVYRRVWFAQIPVMIHSELCHLNKKTQKELIEAGECEWDKGGYFIIKGKERVLISQLRSNYNIPYVSWNKPGEKWKLTAKVRSMSVETGHSSVFKMFMGVDDRTLVVQIPHIKENIPVGLIYRALGVEVNQIKILLKGISIYGRDAEKWITFIIRDYNIVKSTEDALQFIGERAVNMHKIKNVKEFTRQILETEIFPHMGILCSPSDIANFITHILIKLVLTKLKVREVDDLDDYKNKRVETSGILCYELFRQFFKKYCASISKIIETKENPDILSIISRNTFITSGFRTCFSTGQWGVPKNNYIRSGVSQILSRLSYGATISSLRRINIPIGKEAKNTKLRQIHGSQAMYICPAETPEGHSVGIVLNMTLLTRVSKRFPTLLLTKILYNIPLVKNTPIIDGLQTKIFINGIIIGITENIKELIQILMSLRVKKIIPPDVSIGYNRMENELNIYSDEGRLIRPVWKLTPDCQDILFTKTNETDWDNLVDNGFIVYLDNNEIENQVVAFQHQELKKYKNDYCEISPALILGTLTSVIPFPQNNQAPRNCYYTSQCKQAISLYSQSYQLRTDTITHILQTPQKPIVSTRPAKLMGFHEMPNGINVTCAILCYEGWGQEDSVIVNKSAIDRGLFTTYSYRTHTVEERKQSSIYEEIVGLPPFKNRKCDVNYGLLDERGIVRQRFPNGDLVRVQKGDVIVSKISIISDKKGEKTIEDCSIIIKKGEEGYVDKINITTTPQGYRLIKIVIRNEKIPEVGDKLCSRSGQKGTIGMIFNQEDLPFTAEGISPDIIINPLCIPSRMTMAQLLETVLGKSCALKGEEGEGTPWLSSTMDISKHIAKELGMLGYSGDGMEMMYSGTTGEPIGRVFIGPVYYHRLKHIVSEKIHARAQGPVSTLTRQPCEGRSREGGLRMGEMELSASAVSGISKFLKERLFEHSDKFNVPICSQCKQINNTRDYCYSCNNDDIKIVNIPYASKLLIQQLNSMLVKTNFL